MVAIFRTICILYNEGNADNVRFLEEVNSYYSDKTNRFIDHFRFTIPQDLRSEIKDTDLGIILSCLNVSFKDIGVLDMVCVGVFFDKNTLNFLIKIKV
jgi:hypothetical protein